jgi:hypothetical protein
VDRPGPQPLGGAGTSSPKAVSWGEGRIDLFVRGTDAALYHQWFNGSGWGWWEPLGGPFASDPEAVSVGPNRLDVFLRDGFKMVRYLSWNNGWSAWKSIGQVSSGVDAVARNNGQIEVMARRPNDLAVEQFASAVGWEAYSLGGEVR